METVRLKSHVGNDGVLHLDVPIGLHDTYLEVVVVVQPISSTQTVPSGTPEWQSSWAAIEQVRQHYQGKKFSDSTELIREDRQR